LLPKIKKNPKNTNGRLAIPAPAGLLVNKWMDTGTLPTDGRTAGQMCYINIARQYADAR